MTKRRWPSINFLNEMLRHCFNKANRISELPLRFWSLPFACAAEKALESAKSLRALHISDVKNMQ